MKIIREIARPMLAGVFIAGGMDVLSNPEPRAKVAKPVVDKVAALACAGSLIIIDATVGETGI